MRAFGLPVLHFLGELPLYSHHCRVVFFRQGLASQFRAALDRAENFWNILGGNIPIRIEKEKLLEALRAFAFGIRCFAKNKLSLERGCLGSADAVAEISDSLVFSRVIFPQLPQNLLSFVQIEELVFLILEQT